MCDHPGHDRPAAVDRRALLLSGAGVAAYAALGDAQVADAAASARRRRPRTRTLRFSGRFDGVTTPDWYYLPVQVPRGVTRLDVSYRAPATDTGLGFSLNVVDIGIFDESGRGPDRARGFRGWSGGARDRFSIDAGSATPGYLAGPIRPGRWHVVLGPVAVVPPGVAWSVEVTLTFGRRRRPFVPAPAPRRVPGRGAGWYRGDLHTHTVHSDGSWTQARLAAAARRAGLDFIASTEHNTSSAQLTWGRHAPRDLLVLNGEEVTTRSGHWNAVGLPPGTWLDWRYGPGSGRLAEVTGRVRALGGLAIANHPYVPIPATKWDFGYDFAEVDAVEIWNGPWTLDDQAGVLAWHAALVAGTFKPVVAGSDTHGPDTPVGGPQTVVRAQALSTPAIVAALRAGRAWLAESSAVDLTFTARAGGRTATCGERLDAGATGLVDVRLVVRGAPRCLAQVIGPLGPVAGAVTDTRGAATVSARVPAALTPFVRAEVRRLDAAPVLNPLEGVPGLPMVAMTNPVLLR